MEEFRKLEKSDLYDIISVAKASYDCVSFESYVLPDIISVFDKNQRYKITLYGFFRGGKLIHFCGFGKVLGIGNTYELRLSTTLPEFRKMGYATRSLDNRLAILSSIDRDYPVMIQVSTKNTKPYLEHGFIESKYVTKNGFIYMYRMYNIKTQV